MDHDALLDRALAEGTLRGFAHELRASGWSKRAIYEHLYEHALRLDAAGREADVDAVYDLLDLFVGYCAPTARIFPDEPDVGFPPGEPRPL
jgi:hypothetical protein